MSERRTLDTASGRRPDEDVGSEVLFRDFCGFMAAAAYYDDAEVFTEYMCLTADAWRIVDRMVERIRACQQRASVTQ